MEKINLRKEIVYVLDKTHDEGPSYYLRSLERCMDEALNYRNLGDWMKNYKISLFVEVDNEFLLKAYKQRKSEVIGLKKRKRYEKYLELKKEFENIK